MMRLKRSQLILTLLTLVMLVAVTISSFAQSHVSPKYYKILTAEDVSSPAITSASREALGYVAVVKEWISGTIPKSEVQSARVLLAKDLNTFNNLSGTSISNLVNPSSLLALKTIDAVIQKSPQGLLPIQLQETTHTAIDPSLKNITSLAAEVFISFQKDIEAQFRLAMSQRQRKNTRNLLIIYLFLLMAIILLLWISFTFSRRNKVIQASIKTQLDDLALSKEEDKFVFVNLARFARLLQGQRDLMTVSKTVLSKLAPLVNAQHGAFYIMNEAASGEARLQMLSSYTDKERTNIPKEWKIGEDLVGQSAVEKKRILLTDVPDDYIQITSGLGEAKPLNIIVLPMIFENEVKGVIALASFTPYSPTQQAFLDQLAESLGIVINTIEINIHTDELLKQSQTLTEELQSHQEELRETNQELKENASQLELTSKYKSEFLSNMSHELRTPLNNLLILAEHLADNAKGHFDPKEVEFAKLIHLSGNDLLALINEILDLSKIESGTVLVNNATIPFSAVQDQIENTFRHQAKDRGLDFELTFASDLPPTIVTDEMRLLQVMKNLISNAFKFTAKGKVSVCVDRAGSGWNIENKSLSEADEVIAFTVEDTGIGISDDKQRIIFEAFQQGDGATARKYGGTGLGLSISREIAHLLGGELTLIRSTPQYGSTFALYLPQVRAVGETLGKALGSDQRSQEMHQQFQQTSSNLIGKKVLIVDDDMRNIIALTAALENRGLSVLSAENGLLALDLLKETSDIDLVLMDIMMPGMDGYETMREIRKMAKFKMLPIIALTAKAMVGDREKCLEAGASNYLSKPVKVEQLAALMQVWLSK